MSDKAQQDAEIVELFGNPGPAPFDLSGVAGLEEMGIGGRAESHPATDAETFLHVWADVNDEPESFLSLLGETPEDVCDRLDPNWRTYSKTFR